DVHACLRSWDMGRNRSSALPSRLHKLCGGSNEYISDSLKTSSARRNLTGFLRVQWRRCTDAYGYEIEECKGTMSERAARARNGDRVGTRSRRPTRQGRTTKTINDPTGDKPRASPTAGERSS